LKKLTKNAGIKLEYADYFEYTSESPSGLKWKVSHGWNGKYFINKESSVVGTITYQRKTGKPQKWVVKFNGKYLAVHRIIYVMFHSNIDKGMVVDHIDRNPLNNTIENLRVVPRLINNRNYSKYANNTSGKTGVQLTKDNRFRVTWRECGKHCTKSFSISKYGYNMAKKLAYSFRDDVLQRLKQTHNFSSNHGE
jgi:HNH endonuclease/AP2 domain